MGAAVTLARPKSSTFTRPSPAIITLAGFQIAMHDALVVRSGERIGEHAGHSISLATGRPSPPVAGPATLLHQLHRQKMRTVASCSTE